MNPIRVAIFVVSALTLAACDSHAASPSAWSIKTHVDQMTDKKTSYAVDTAKSSITDNYGQTFTPRLLMACPSAGNKVQIGIQLGAVMSGDIIRNIHPANVRFDKNKEFKTFLSADGSGNGYYFNDPSVFLREGSKAEHMLFQFTTALLSNEKTVNFDISGMNDVLKKMQCHG